MTDSLPDQRWRVEEATPVLPLVTVLVPCRNEARFIGDCLRSILRNGYPESLLQVLVVDGLSEDGTTDIVSELVAEHPCITLLMNERRITPVALNLGIQSAKGEFILWMSAHNLYEAGYILSCVTWAMRSGADNVGGVILCEAREKTLFGRAIASALAHRLGNGGSKFRSSLADPVWADTVFGGCYRKDVFERVGLFNEKLVRGQDFEFNARLRLAGMRTLLVPTIRSTYFARSSPREFIKHNWANGVWAILPFKYTNVVPISFRHVVPMLFVGSLIIGFLSGIVFHPLAWTALLILGIYLMTVFAISVTIAVQQRSTRILTVMPLVFVLLHIPYGLGSLWAAARSVGGLTSNLSRVCASAFRQWRAGPNALHARNESRTL